jgi:hypothetical protein
MKQKDFDAYCEIYTNDRLTAALKFELISHVYLSHKEELLQAAEEDKNNGWPRPLVRAYARMLQSV